MMLIAGAPFLTDFQHTRLLRVSATNQPKFDLAHNTTNICVVKLTDEALDKAKKLLGVHDDIELNPAEQGELQVIVVLGLVRWPWSRRRPTFLIIAD